MKYSLIAITFAVACASAADVSCAVSCMSEALNSGKCKRAHYDCVVRQCDAMASLQDALAAISDLCAGLSD